MVWFAVLQARIKAINTFFAKNGYRVVDSSVYPQPVQTQAQFASPLFMQPVYSPQQYSIYSIVPQTWSPNPAPYFETPLVSNSWWEGEQEPSPSGRIWLIITRVSGCSRFLGQIPLFYDAYGPNKAAVSEELPVSPLAATYFKEFWCEIPLSCSLCCWKSP